jgi:hypothetical protein
MDTLIRQGDGLDKSSPYKKLHDKKAGLMNQIPARDEAKPTNVI